MVSPEGATRHLLSAPPPGVMEGMTTALFVADLSAPAEPHVAESSRQSPSLVRKQNCDSHSPVTKTADGSLSRPFGTMDRVQVGANRWLVVQPSAPQACAIDEIGFSTGMPRLLRAVEGVPRSPSPGVPSMLSRLVRGGHEVRSLRTDRKA
jgi:hypothetical protein